MFLNDSFLFFCLHHDFDLTDSISVQSMLATSERENCWGTSSRSQPSRKGTSSMSCALAAASSEAAAASGSAAVSSISEGGTLFHLDPSSYGRLLAVWSLSIHRSTRLDEPGGTGMGRWRDLHGRWETREKKKDDASVVEADENAQTDRPSSSLKRPTKTTPSAHRVHFSIV